MEKRRLGESGIEGLKKWRIRELGNERIGGLKSWRIGEMEKKRIGKLENWRIGDPTIEMIRFSVPLEVAAGDVINVFREPPL